MNVSQPCIDLIKALIVLDPKKRLTASETVVKARSVIKELELRIQSPEFRVRIRTLALAEFIVV